MKPFRKPIPDRPHGWLAASLLLTLGGPLWAVDLDLELRSSWPFFPRGPAQAVAVSGSYAYAVVNNYAAYGLQVIDISDPTLPQQVAVHDTSSPASDVTVLGDRAFLADGCYGLQVLDVSNPATPRWLGGYDTSGQAKAVAVSGDYAYLADGEEGLQVIDISNPTSPQRVCTVTNMLNAHAVAVSGSYAFVAGSWFEGTNRLAGFRVIDISDPAEPQPVGGYDTSGDVHAVAVSGHYAYVAEGHGPDADGLYTIDISSPANPRWVGFHDTQYEPSDVAVAGRYAYLVSWVSTTLTFSALEVFDVSDPANPQPLAATDIGGVAVALSGHTAYVVYLGGAMASRPQALLAIDIRLSPRIESAEFGGNVFRLVFRGEAGRTIRLQRSPDLKTWEDWVILTATGDSQAVADPSAGSHPCQFYRAVGQ